MAQKLETLAAGIGASVIEESKHTSESLATAIYATKTYADLMQLLLVHAEDLEKLDVYMDPKARLVTKAIAKHGLGLVLEDFNEAVDKIDQFQELQEFLNHHSSLLNELNIEDPKHKAFAKKIILYTLSFKIVDTEDKEYRESALRFFNEDNQNLLNAIKKAKPSDEAKVLAEMQKLIETADLSMRDFFGTTLLMVAANSGCVKITELLLDAGCHESEEGNTDQYEETVLSYAVRTGHPPLVTLLLTHKNGVKDIKKHFANDVPIVEFAKSLQLHDIARVLEEHAPKQPNKRLMRRK